MADRQKLLNLAERCEEASDGSEALDLAITEATTGKPVGHRQTYVPVTRSLDAAMSLVPAVIQQSPVSVSVWSNIEGGRKHNGWAEIQRNIGNHVVGESMAATPALALTAAALRALAAMEDNDG